MHVFRKKIVGLVGFIKTFKKLRIRNFVLYKRNLILQIKQSFEKQTADCKCLTVREVFSQH